jgi:two-component system CheB/CheR fusion protein
MTSAEALRRRIPDILRRWEAAVRAEMPSTSDEPRPVLLNDIPVFLAQLCQALEAQADPMAATAPAAQVHGWQRRVRLTYTLADLVREYRLLRDAILDGQPLAGTDLRIVLHAIDRGIAESANYFAAIDRGRRPRSGEERYRSVVNTVIDGIITIDEHAIVHTFNPAAERIFGYDATEVMGRNVKLLMPEPYRGEHNGYVRSHLTTGVKRIIGVGREVVGLRKDGTTFPMDLAVSEFRMDDRRFFTGIVRDITERKHLEGELLARAEALADANRGKDDFLAMLGHELRNPLAPIRASVELIRMQHVQAPALVRATDIIDRQTSHLTRIVDDLLDVARLTRGKLQIRKQRVELGPLVAQAVDAFRDTTAANQQALHLSIDDPPLWVDADPTRLSQVIANLVQNAVKFTPAGGRIDVSVATERERAVVRVRDTGAGIDPPLLPHVFDLFTQGWRTADGGLGGLGLGLTLVRRLVEQHAGTIRATSGGAGRGSEFTVALPVAGPAAPRPATRAAAPAVPGSSRRVLVVDDNVDAATALGYVLQALGHAATVVHHPHDAIEAALADPPDLVLMDIGLPDMDGYAVARRLREDPRLAATPLVAITGYGQEEDKMRARDAGFDRHLTKPVDFAMLRTVLAEFGDKG